MRSKFKKKNESICVILGNSMPDGLVHSVVFKNNDYFCIGTVVESAGNEIRSICAIPLWEAAPFTNHSV